MNGDERFANIPQLQSGNKRGQEGVQGPEHATAYSPYGPANSALAAATR